MHRHKMIVYLILIVLFSSVLVIDVSSEENNPSFWDDRWSYREEISIPIDTKSDVSKFQPIDISFEFKQKCWARNAKDHSIRICTWDGAKWHELESQIYNLENSDNTFHIEKCGIIFLIPEFADGNERYFVYYDDTKKPAPDYIDHVDIEDSYYYYEPIKGISAEGDYYKIIEDGYCVFGVGQKGKVIHRKLSQTVIKLKPEVKEFDITKSDNIASFCFSYHKGEEFEDEVSSDSVLVAKQLLVDGNIMVEFRIVSESPDQTLRTSNIYKYYYCPTEKKRMNIHVKHEVLKDDQVEGIINVDGRYGAIVSFQLRSERIKKISFGNILPYLHVYSEEDKIREYQMNQDPEGKDREWIISYLDDCDIGEKAWFSYDEGLNGKAQGIILRSNKGIVKHGEDRDGVQLKVAVNEYMNALGTDIDYAAINFGRNSYEKAGSHDLKIRSGLTVEYDAEFFVTHDGGFKAVEYEAEKYQKLIEHRNIYDPDLLEDIQKIYTITAIPRFTGRIMSNPLFLNFSGLKLTAVYGELYQNGKLISKQYINKPLFGQPSIRFPKLGAGRYSIKIYREIGNKYKLYIGFESIEIKKDKKVNINCTWPKKIKVSITDQNHDLIKNFKLKLLKNDQDLVNEQLILYSKDIVLIAPANIRYPYYLNGYYKGFKILSEEINFLKSSITKEVNLYDLSINIHDKLGFSPGVKLYPYLTSSDMEIINEIQPSKKDNGIYFFKNLPSATYNVHVSYGSYSLVEEIRIDSKDKNLDLQFKALYPLNIDILDSRGNDIDDADYSIDIYRNKREVYKDISPTESIYLPPGEYNIYAALDGRDIGLKNIVITNEKEVKVLTSINPVLPILFNILTIIFIIEILIVFLLRKISLNSLLKIIAMCLILLSIFQPWWYLHATSNEIYASKTTELFIQPQVMIDKINYNNYELYDLATIPEMFTNFEGILLFIIISGFILIGISFVPNILQKRRHSLILIIASVLFLILVAAAFYFGMSKLTEISLGEMQGCGNIIVDLPTSDSIQMYATWGLGTGFYLCIMAALIGCVGGIIDLLQRKSWFKILF